MDVTKFLAEHPYISLLITAAIGWLVRHKGIGAGLLPGLAAQTPALKPLVPMLPQPGPLPVPATPVSPPGLPEHPAVTFLQKSIDAGVAADAMPIVQKLVSPKG